MNAARPFVVDHALLLAPGAGASAQAPGLVAVAEAMSDRIFVRRMDFPYRLAGRKAPDRAPVLIQAIRDAATALLEDTGIASNRLYLGGRSMGGRMCSMAVAEGLPAAGLVLMSYPLHPPGKPDKLRTDHFPLLDLPCLFVSGTRDAFGKPEEFERHIGAIPGEVTYEWIEGGDHGMSKYTPDAVSKWFSAHGI